tara:strand:+ start:917 stop:1081 length:165 start_codon:yes stop_codon:yes gene_type:complete
MKNSDFSSVSEPLTEITDKNKILCKKCGGSGNVKTPENSRRTCLSCFGKGYRFY